MSDTDTLPAHQPEGEARVDTDDICCEHGTAMDVHCCNCHSGFLFDVACVCVFNEGDSRVDDGTASASRGEEFERGYRKGASDCSGIVAKMDDLRSDLARLRQQLKVVEADRDKWFNEAAHARVTRIEEQRAHQEIAKQMRHAAMVKPGRLWLGAQADRLIEWSDVLDPPQGNSWKS